MENAQRVSAVSTDGSSEKREPSTPLAFAYSKQPYRIPGRTRSEPTASPSTAQPRRSTLAGRKEAETQGSTEHTESIPWSDPRWTWTIEQRYTAVLRSSDGSDR